MVVPFLLVQKYLSIIQTFVHHPTSYTVTRIQ